MALFHELPPPLKNHLEEIRKAAERSADLIRQLLAFARKQAVTPRILDLNKVIESMLKMLQRLIGEDIELAWQPQPDLWKVRLDRSQVEQILANLCTNSRDAISGVGRISIATASIAFGGEQPTPDGFLPGEYVQLTVSDTGCGIKSDELQKIFEPFYTTKEVGKGTGLGLAMIYGIVKQNNGFINVSSEEGAGTTFRIFFPRYLDQEAPEEEKRMPEKIPSGRETILLVEDEAAILEIATIMLRELGYNVLATPRISEALELAAQHAGKIQLLITDVVMPEMNGSDLAARILPLSPGLKHLFMSGYTADVIAQQGIIDRGLNFLQKPFTIAQLAAKVREALDKT
jgi:CheY-like chemotaxis protein